MFVSLLPFLRTFILSISIGAIFFYFTKGFLLYYFVKEYKLSLSNSVRFWGGHRSRIPCFAILLNCGRATAQYNNSLNPLASFLLAHGLIRSVVLCPPSICLVECAFIKVLFSMTSCVFNNGFPIKIAPF